MTTLTPTFIHVCSCCGECRRGSGVVQCSICRVEMVRCPTLRMTLFVTRLPREDRIAYAAGLWRSRDHRDPKWKRYAGSRTCGNSSSPTSTAGSIT
jgi:hypothetical protein